MLKVSASFFSCGLGNCKQGDIRWGSHCKYKWKSISSPWMQCDCSTWLFKQRSVARRQRTGIQKFTHSLSFKWVKSNLRTPTKTRVSRGLCLRRLPRSKRTFTLGLFSECKVSSFSACLFTEHVWVLSHTVHLLPSCLQNHRGAWCHFEGEIFGNSVCNRLWWPLHQHDTGGEWMTPLSQIRKICPNMHQTDRLQHP